MPEPDLAHRRLLFRQTTNGSDIEVRHLLRLFAELIRCTQTNLDKRQVYLAQSFLSSIGSDPVIKQLLGLLRFRRYTITELHIEFAVIKENYSSSPSSPVCFRLIPYPMKETSVRNASIKVTRNIQTCAEFRIDDETLESIFIINKDNICSDLLGKEQWYGTPE